MERNGNMSTPGWSRFSKLKGSQPSRPTSPTDVIPVRDAANANPPLSQYLLRRDGLRLNSGISQRLHSR